MAGKHPKRQNQTITSELKEALSHVASASAKLQHLPAARSAISDVSIDMHALVKELNVQEVTLGAVTGHARSKAVKEALDKQAEVRADTIDKLSAAIGTAYRHIESEAKVSIEQQKQNKTRLEELLDPVREFIDTYKDSEQAAAGQPRPSVQETLGEWQEQFAILADRAESEMGRLHFDKLREYVAEAAELSEKNHDINQRLEELTEASRELRQATQSLLKASSRALSIYK